MRVGIDLNDKWPSLSFRQSFWAVSGSLQMHSAPHVPQASAMRSADNLDHDVLCPERKGQGMAAGRPPIHSSR